MIDKLFASNQTIYIRNGNGKPDVHQLVVRNLEETESRIYGECTIEGETWVVRYIGNAKWQSVGKRVDLDAMIQGLSKSHSPHASGNSRHYPGTNAPVTG